MLASELVAGRHPDRLPENQAVAEPLRPRIFPASHRVVLDGEAELDQELETLETAFRPPEHLVAAILAVVSAAELETPVEALVADDHLPVFLDLAIRTVAQAVESTHHQHHPDVQVLGQETAATICRLVGSRSTVEVVLQAYGHRRSIQLAESMRRLRLRAEASARHHPHHKTLLTR